VTWLLAIVSLTTEKVLATFPRRRADSMTRSELVQRVADKSLHLHRSDVEKAVNVVLEDAYWSHISLSAIANRRRLSLAASLLDEAGFNRALPEPLGPAL
jgi:hypothetical protein